ncbi:NACHT, LRR and PYD domains-containing protein 6-like [Morone saxatilis]|uniref:NACHT, LRR and PYD domains-containing protein 6-like n=1 Tax=Morone saxatilis TaxID=34816 RepID=UPI0015E1FCEF|nr:NACHT, LRR and PYD domains-containing protein 6-like [Morone saxatilis]
MKRFNETSVRGKTGATMTKEVLLSNLDDLGEDDFKRFKWFLKDERLKDSSTIPWNKLEKAKTWETVDLMIQTYTLPGAVEVTKQVLKKINRNDLLQGLEPKGSVDVSDVGQTSESKEPSSSQSEGKAAVFSGMYGSPERPCVVFIFEKKSIVSKFYFLCETLCLYYN